MNQSSGIIHEVTETKFFSISQAEILKLSVVEVNNVKYLDEFKQGQPNSILDKRMGATKFGEQCQTCGYNFKQCQGHFGHINLAVPVINVLSISKLRHFLKLICFDCRLLIYSEQMMLYFYTKLLLLEAGLVELAQQILTSIEKQYSDKLCIQALDIIRNGSQPTINMVAQDLIQEVHREFFNLSRAHYCSHCKNKLQSKIISDKFGQFFHINENQSTFLSGNVLSNLIQPIFDQHSYLFALLFGKRDNLNEDFPFVPPTVDVFIIQSLIVLPNRLRPFQDTYLAGLSQLYQDILEQNNKLVNSQNDDLINNINELQKKVNFLFNSDLNLNATNPGLRQDIDKKPGLFRNNLMGKRVNFAARSVISPDINLATSEVGIPDVFAKNLTFPEPVNQFNLQTLQGLVINGSDVYPGANFLSDSDGKIIKLDQQTLSERKVIASQLSEQLDKIRYVHRHTLPGDPLIFNRQPSLHRSSMLVHKARIMPGHSRTIRFHYANCKGYNADFDGDEMNLHLPQQYAAVSESLNLALNDLHYISPTAGNPLRELMQDSVIGGILLTKLDTLLTQEQFSQLCWQACSHLNKMLKVQDVNEKLTNLDQIDKISNSNPFSSTCNTKFIGELIDGEIVRGNGDGFGYVAKEAMAKYLGRKDLIPQQQFKSGKVTIYSQFELAMNMEQPAIIFPTPFWTGKQVISVMLQMLCPNTPLNMRGDTTLAPQTWGHMASTESKTVIVNNQLVSGLIDKKHIATTQYGLVHSIQEICGGEAAGAFITAYGKVTSFLLQQQGFTCSLEDMILQTVSDQERFALESQLNVRFDRATHEFLQLDNKSYTSEQLKNLINEKNKSDPSFASRYDSALQKIAGDITSELSQICHPRNLLTHLPQNNLAFMILSGAKGSVVNLQMMTSCLGQQSLEGKRVPISSYGKTLPCIKPGDNIHAISGGYVFDRYISGLRPISFFFHHQAGREGLIDTAIKTATSGYFQRCVIKALEGLHINYYGSVCLGDGSLIQPLYGGDGIDTCKVKMLQNFKFIAQNFDNYKRILLANFSSNWNTEILKSIEKLQELVTQFNNESDEKKCSKLRVKMQKYWERLFGGEMVVDDSDFIKQIVLFLNNMQNYPLISQFSPYKCIDITSTVFAQQLNDFIKSTNLLGDSAFMNNSLVKYEEFRRLVNIKCAKSLMNPGEAVGVIAGQGIGEPSTQLTLNTFHLAGHGAANVTLGIPRLREIVMSASKVPKTPFIQVQVLDLQTAKQLISQFKLVKLQEIISTLKITEKVICDRRVYTLDIELSQHANDFSETSIRSSLILFQQKWLKQYIIKALKLIEGQEIIIQDAEEIRAARNIGEDEVGDEGNGSAISDADDDSQSSIDSMQDIEQVEQKLDPENSDEKQTVAVKNQFAIEDIIDKILDKKYSIQFSISNKYHLLILSILEKAISRTILNQITGMQYCFLRQEKDKIYVDIEGNNISAIRLENAQKVMINEMLVNDIYQIQLKYGIEAARNAIIEEVSKVFNVYHISVDEHHLSLIADTMTFNGNYRSCNRTGMKIVSQILQGASFETSTNVLKNAAISGSVDHMVDPSSNIIFGQLINIGTGCFDVVQELIDE